MSETNSIHPTSILRSCTLGNSISIWPFCFISDTDLGDNVAIEGNVRIEKSVLKNDVQILWWSIIRESTLEEWCVIGCEVKKSHLGKRNKAKHPGTTIVNAKTGEKVNFWGGVKCANYDGIGKGKFVIEDDVFLWCNTVLSVRAEKVTTVHARTKIGANVHIAEDLPPDSLVYLDRETGKTTVRAGYYVEWKKKN